MTVLMLAASLVQGQRDSMPLQTITGVSIPAELTTTVRAERARRGDPVEFRTLEAVLISNGLVMPANTKLSGRIVGAAPRQGDKPSWLVLLVERGEWKKQSVPLHAYISAQMTISSASQKAPQIADGSSTSAPPRRTRAESARVAIESGIDISSTTRLPQDSGAASQPDLVSKPVPMKDLRIVRDKDGIAYLFCATSNLKLPSGSLFVLQNESEREKDKTLAGSPQPNVSQPQ